MHIRMIGLGKMGFSMRERLRKGGVEVTGYDSNSEVTDVASIDKLFANGRTASLTLAESAQATTPRWCITASNMA